MSRPSSSSSDSAMLNTLSTPIVSGPRIGGHILVDQLIEQGVTHAFGVPGESYLAVLDGLYERAEQIQFIVTRHEGGAAVMAESYAKLTGRTGVCMVTRGPGAANAAIGVHTARQDSTPMLLLIGQVGGDFKDREAFQELNYEQMFGPLSKWVAQIDRVERIPEYIARAFQVAQSGRPGPVVLALPEDMLTATATVRNAPKAAPVFASPSPNDLQKIRTLLSSAERPIAILGGYGWNRETCDRLTEWAQTNGLPLSCAFRFQDLIDNRDPTYIGDVGIAINPQLAQRIRTADVILTVGARLGEMTTQGYSLIDIPVPSQTLIHVHSGAEELGSVYQAQVMVNSGPTQFVDRLIDAPLTLNEDQRQQRLALIAAGRADYDRWQQEPEFLETGNYKINLWRVMQTCAQLLPADTIVTNGAGNFATWAHRFWRYAGLRTQLAPTSGAMGHGLPAGIAAQIIAPNRSVLVVAGDGDLQMTLQELGTAIQYGAAPLILVFNNGIYGTIRMHQNKNFPGRPSGTDMFNPNFAMLAQAYGALGLTVRSTGEFHGALVQARDFIVGQQKPALIDLHIDAHLLTTRG